MSEHVRSYLERAAAETKEERMRRALQEIEGICHRVIRENASEGPLCDIQRICLRVLTP